MADFFAAASDLDRILDEFEENEKPEPIISKSKHIENIKATSLTINRDLGTNHSKNEISVNDSKESDLLIDFSTPEHNFISNPQKVSPMKHFPPNSDLDFLLSISDNDMGAFTANIASSTTLEDHGLQSSEITKNSESTENLNLTLQNNEKIVASPVKTVNISSKLDNNHSPKNKKLSNLEKTIQSTAQNDENKISQLNKQTTSQETTDVDFNNSNLSQKLEEHNTESNSVSCQDVSCSKVHDFSEDVDVDEAEFEQFMAETSAYSEQILNTMTSQIGPSHLSDQKNEPAMTKVSPERHSNGELSSEMIKVASENSANIVNNYSEQNTSKTRTNSITSQIMENLRKNEVLVHSNENDTKTNLQTPVSQNLETYQIMGSNMNNIGVNSAEQHNTDQTSNNPEPDEELTNYNTPSAPSHENSSVSSHESIQPSSVHLQQGDGSFAPYPRQQPQIEGERRSPERSPQEEIIEAESGRSNNSPHHQLPPDGGENNDSHHSQQESSSSVGQHYQGERSSFPSVSPPSYSAVLAEDYSAGTRVNEDYSDNNNQRMVLPEESETPIINEPAPSDQLPASVETPSTSEPSGSLITRPGHTKPHWIPDEQSSICTKCESKFSFTKRRHHCRACGQIFCNNCCNLRSRLEYLEFNEARVCITCYASIIQADELQAEANLRQQLLLNPNTSTSNHSNPRPVLKNSDDSSGSSTPKSVRFADGTRPDHPATLPDTPPPPSRLSRSAKSRHRNGSTSIYPPIIAGYDDEGGYIVDEHSELSELERMLKTQDGVVFLLSPNLFVLLKIINYSGSQCSYFASVGLDLVGQSEVGLIISSQSLIPLQAFTLYAHLFNQARKGKAVHSMDFLLISDFIESTNPTLFGSNDYSGVLFCRRTMQEDTSLMNNDLCERLHIASNTTTFSSMLFGLLVHKNETPWAKLFPPRLLLGLGAKYKQYPCPLVNHENRTGVYQDVSNTILAILCDCRNYKYKVVVVPGLSVVVSDRNVIISIPCNRFSDMVKIMNSSNEHVLAFGADNISSELETCHLTAIQDESDRTYHTEVLSADQSISDNNNNAGAAFVVFNGSLKTGCIHQAKCTVVEDGVMIQLIPERMLTLKESLRSMDDHRIRCQSPNSSSEESENDVGRSVEIRWISDDTKFNIGLLSPIDFRSFEGVIGYNVQGKSEKKSKQHLLRWNQVFFFKSTNDVMDMSRLAEQVANGCFHALVPHAKTLREAGQIKVGVRVNIHPDDVGYSVGSKGLPLSDQCLNSLDDNLIPLIHDNSGSLGADEDPVEFELIFSVLEIKSSWKTN